jgi:hypothetical protein
MWNSQHQNHQLPGSHAIRWFRKEAQKIIDDDIYFYNYERIQIKTEQTPSQLRCLSG